MAGTASYSKIRSEGREDADRLFIDVYDMINAGKFIKIQLSPDDKQVRKLLSDEQIGMLKQYGSEVKSHSGVRKHLTSQGQKAARNKRKIGNVVVKGVFTTINIGIGTAAVIVATTSVPTMGLGALVAPAVGLGMAIASIPVQIVAFFGRKGVKHIHRHLYWYRTANATTLNIRKELRTSGRSVKLTDHEFRALEQKFRHKHLSRLVDNWKHIRTLYLLGKVAEAPVNEVISKGIKAPVFCHDFALAGQYLLAYNKIYTSIEDEVVILDQLFQYAERTMKAFPAKFTKILRDTVTKIDKFDKSFELKAYGSAASTSEVMKSRALDFHDTECINSNRLPKKHRICYMKGRDGKGYFSLSDWEKSTRPKTRADRQEVEKFKSLYTDNLIVRILEDASHSKQFKPHYRKGDLFHLKKLHNPKSFSMAEDSAKLLGYPDLELLCNPSKAATVVQELKSALDRLSSKKGSEKVAKDIVKNLKSELAKQQKKQRRQESVENREPDATRQSNLAKVPEVGRDIFLGLIQVGTGGALSDDLVKTLAAEIQFIVNGLKGDMDEAEGIELIGEVTDVVTGKLVDVLSILASNAINDIGGFSGWEMLEGFNPIGKIVEGAIAQGLTTQGALDIASLIVGIVEVGYDLIVYPLIEHANKKLNLKGLNKTDPYALRNKKQRTATGSKVSVQVDKNRLDRISNLRAVFKSNGFMEAWAKEYVALGDEMSKLEKMHQSFRPNKCYHSYEIIRQLLIVKAQYQTVRFYHRYVGEFNYGVTSKARRMAVKNSLRFHRLYMNAQKYYTKKENICTVNGVHGKSHPAICYHSYPQGAFPKTVFNEDQNFESPKTNTNMGKVMDNILTFGNKEADDILKNCRHISNPDYAKSWEEQKEALFVTSQKALLRDALKKRRRAMTGGEDTA